MNLGRDITQVSHCLACGMPTEELDEKGHPYCLICQYVGKEDSRQQRLKKEKIITNNAR